MATILSVIVEWSRPIYDDVENGQSGPGHGQRKLQRFAYRSGLFRYSQLARLFGKSWAYHHGRSIMDLELPGEASGAQGAVSGAVRMNRPAIDAAKSSEASGVPANPE